MDDSSWHQQQHHHQIMLLPRFHHRPQAKIKTTTTTTQLNMRKRKLSTTSHVHYNHPVSHIITSTSTTKQKHLEKMCSSSILIVIKLLLIQAVILQISTYHQIHCQPAMSASMLSSFQDHNKHHPHTHNRQYQQQHQRSSSQNNINNNNNPLVREQALSAGAASSSSMLTHTNYAQSLPLTRQQQMPSSSVELDNVIESTTSLLSLQQQQTLAGGGSNILEQLHLVSPASNCQLPQTWAGSWYQANKEPIRVTNTEISDKGLCRDQKGDKYLFESTTSNKQSCLVCLVINERHLNVLQYKESSCQPIPASYLNKTTNNIIINEDHSLLDSVCSDINGDAQLESLFRLDTPQIECPIAGQYSFTYDNCREPHSSLDSCIDKKSLNFKFAACPDVPGSESKSEVLKCYADWSEGNNYYMIGRLQHASNQQDKGKFRCFVYEKSLDGKTIQMAQSLEESCYGLINANEGPKTFRLAIKQPTAHKCNFPSYIQSQSENWLSVDNSLIYMFNQNSTKYQVKETKEGNVIEEATCLQQFTYPPSQPHFHNQHTRSNTNQAITSANRRFPSTATSNYQTQADQSTQQQQHHQISSRLNTNDIVYLVQITKNCYTTNYCVRFYKRSNGIVQIDYFITSPGSDNQCRNAYMVTPQTQIITSTNLEHQRCPFEGAYTIDASLDNDLTYNPSNIFICPRQSFMTAQCESPTRMKIHSKCTGSNKFFNKNLYCLGSWTTNGLVRLLLADDERQRYSAWYRDYGGGMLSLPPSDGATGGATTLESGATLSPQAQALQLQQQQTAITRSQQLLLPATNTVPVQHQQQPPIIALAQIVDLQIALITSLPVIAKPMAVRLTRRNQCSELRNYMNQPAFGGAGGASINAPSYAPQGSSSSSISPASGMLLSLIALTITLLLSTSRHQPLIARDHQTVRWLR